LLETGSDVALREYSWATYGPVSRFEFEPFAEVSKLVDLSLTVPEDGNRTVQVL
jgi:hypothetical protein